IPTDLMRFLPPPESPDFPVLSLGMILLFDQAGAHLFSGADQRYLNSYFRPLRLRLLAQLSNLPSRLRPWRLERWEEQGWSFEHWAIRQIFFNGPLTHSEDIDNHALQRGLHENLRALVERRVKRRDPNRDTAGSDAHDTMLFVNLIRTGPPEDENVSMEKYLWWSCRIMDAHMPILREFGRYPYNVMWKGEEYTPEEKRYLERTQWFHVTKMNEGELNAMKEDMKAGRWPPLKEQ
ncbi:hypothetical protein NA57DRAFT_30143, partial [Rhizodiscina lignyota]